MVNDSKYSLPVVDERGAAFGRLASRVLETLNEAVDLRRAQGETITAIAYHIGCHKSLLSRILNGNTSNLTLRTISDILWATRHDPQDFRADPIELISPNWCDEEPIQRHTIYQTTNISMPEMFRDFPFKTSRTTQVLELDGV